MFLLSKLIAISFAIIASGTTSSFLIPYFKDKNLTNWLSKAIWKVDISKNQFNFQKLDEESETRLKELEKWFKKLSTSQTVANVLKRIEFARIQKIFENISKAEAELKNLFEKISSSLSSLLAKNKNFFEISIQKLEAEKKEKLQKTIKESYTVLQDALNKWENSLSQITCLIDAEGKNGSNCDSQPSLISSIVNSMFSFASLFSNSVNNSANGQQNTNGQEGGEKAKQELEQVKKSLLQTINELRRENSRFKLFQANATSQEIISSLKYVYYSSLLTVLSSQQENLQKVIKSDNEEADKKIKSISNYQKNLKGFYLQYSNLKQQESIFHNWTEIFKERILRNRSDKAREIIFKYGSS